MRGQDAGRTQEQPNFCSDSDSAFSRMLFPWVNHFPFLTLHVPFFFLFPTGQPIRQQCSEQPPCAVTMPGPGESLLKLMDSFPGPTGLRGMKTDMQICRWQQISYSLVRLPTWGERTRQRGAITGGCHATWVLAVRASFSGMG